MLKQRLSWRRQLYMVIPAVTAILQTYGLLTAEQAGVWASLAISLVGLWLAWFYPFEAGSIPSASLPDSAPFSDGVFLEDVPHEEFSTGDSPSDELSRVEAPAGEVPGSGPEE